MVARVGTQMPPIGFVPHSSSPHSDQRTILVASNQPSVLEFVSGFLLKASYNVLSATGGDEALREMKIYKHEIHLLLSTLDMPGINGLGLAAQVSQVWPSVKVLLMSECSGGTLILNDGWHFLPKPFVQSQLNALISTLISPADAIPKDKRPGLVVSGNSRQGKSNGHP